MSSPAMRRASRPAIPIWCSWRLRITHSQLSVRRWFHRMRMTRQGATDLLSFLLSDVAQRQIASDAGVALMPGLGPEPSAHLRPIRLDTGLLVYGDQLRRAGLLAEWNAAMVQP